MAVACAIAGAGWAPLRAAEIGGRYAAQAPAGTPAAAAATAADAGPRLVEITAHRNAYAVSYETGFSRHKRHGWGLLDGEQLVVALSTGGAAYGVAIYHHLPGEHTWSGPWISSLDGGASLGKIRFEDGAALEGRHALVCSRPGAGSVSGTVTIKPAADGYQLTISLGHAVYYRGVGLLLPGDRLAVGWSFGSAPELAIYQVGAKGSLAEHHVWWAQHPGSAASLDNGQFVPISNDEYFAAMSQGTFSPGSGSSPMPLFANRAGSGADELPAADASAAQEAAALILGPAAPRVKTWSYTALMRQFGADGWAERWLERQLTAEELRLLHAAVRRHETHQGGDGDLESRNIGALLEEERTREAGR
jgi:hypothetical protein